MNYWNETPLFRFLLIFIGGILLAVYFPFFSFKVTLILCIVFIFQFFILFFISRSFSDYRRRWLPGVVSYLAVFLAGYVLTYLSTEKNYPEHFRNFSSPSFYIGYLEEPADEKATSEKTILKIQFVNENGKWISTTGNCLVYFAKDSLSEQLRYGDEILFTEKPTEVPLASNPSQFDYKRWLGFNKIFDQVHISAGGWRLIDSHKGYSLLEFSFSLREKFLRVFRENYVTGQDYAVLSALILGYEGDIDQETINAYAASGALHVLSVSGLHVGIIYMAINILLSFLNYNRRTRLFKSIIIILFLWFYAMLTGLSPSVLRSAAMLSFIVVGNMFRQRTNLYNTLAASAFFLLGLNPYLLMQVGFQLSYVAVLGIIFLQKTIHRWIDPPTWFLRQVWSITSVSIAAQTATFPLGLLYFHQFPNYFLFSNLIIIPASTVIIFGGIFLLAISWWHSVAIIAGILLGYIVHGMNWVALFVEKLPWSMITGISISVFETWVIYISISAIVAFFFSKEAKYFLLAVVTIVFILASQIMESKEQREQKQLIVYSIKGKAFLNIIDGRENFVLTDSGTLNNRSLMLFNVYHYWWDCGESENKIIVMNDSFYQSDKLALNRGIIYWNNFRIARINDTAALKSLNSQIDVDFVIISNNLRTKLKYVMDHFTFKKLIIDSSNSLGKTKRWIQEAQQLGISVYSVQLQGAFVFDHL